MFKKLIFFISLLFFFIFGLVIAQEDSWKCIQLNTNVPFVWDKIWNCEEAKGDWQVTAGNAFPKLIWWMSKLTIAFIMVFSFLFLIAWGILIAISGADQSAYAKWKELIIKVIIWIALLWLAGVILHIINPNFFK